MSTVPVKGSRRRIANIDDIGWDLLETLQSDGRASYAELGRKVGLSAPAVAARMHRLEEAGLIRGYGAVIDHEALGLDVEVFVRMNVSGPPDKHEEFVHVASQVAQVLDLWRISGVETYLLRVVAESVSDLERVLHPLWRFGDTVSGFVMSKPIEARPILRAAVDG